jgi:DHA3 family macrolide efflux protein-like MFS transporter
MLSGALMTFASLEIIFFLDVITAAIAIVIVFFFVKVPANEKNKTETPRQKGISYFHDLKEGMKYIKKNEYVLRMIVISALFTFLIAPAAFLTPLQVARNYGDEVWRLSAIEIIFSAGMMLGGIWIGFWGGFKNRIYTMALSTALSGILTTVLGITSIFWFYLFIMLLLGITIPFWNAPSMVLLQTSIEPTFMGRVLSVFTMIASTMMPLGMIVFGPVSDVVSIDLLLIGTGILITLLGIPLVTSKVLLNAGRS